MNPPATAPRTGNSKATQLLLNTGHAIDHMFLLIFATAVTSIAAEFGVARWEDLMPYGVAAFFLFGIGSLPSGKLGDHWGRRKMMTVFFFGMGASALLVSVTQTPLQLAAALALLGCFSSIYHPVGIPMLLQGAVRPGWTIGVDGLVGNLGVAAAAVTGQDRPAVGNHLHRGVAHATAGGAPDRPHRDEDAVAVHRRDPGAAA